MVWNYSETNKLEDNVSHKMLQCDAFTDNPQPKSAQLYVMELLVTPTPVIYTDMTIAGLQVAHHLRLMKTYCSKNFFLIVLIMVMA